MIPLFAGARIVAIVELVGISLVQVALAVVSAFCVQQVFDRALLESSATAPADMNFVGALFVGSLSAVALLEIRRLTTAERLGLGYVAALRRAMFERIMHAAPEAIHRRREGGLLLPFVGDLTAIKKWVSDGLVRAISSGVTVIVLTGALYWIAPSLAMMVAAIVVASALFALFMSEALTRAIRRTRNRRGALANFVASSARAAATVQAFNRIERERQRLERRTDALMTASVRLAQLSGVMSASAILLGGALVALALGAGVLNNGQGSLTPGVLAGVISLVGLASTAVRDLGTAFELGKRAQASFSKVRSALVMAPSLNVSGRERRLQMGEGVIEISDVSAGAILAHVTLSARPGDVINIEGASGAGKSLLAALVVRLRDPDRGAVCLDGQDLRRVSARTLRRHVGFAGQAAPLMRGSVLMNLKYRMPGVSSEDFASVAGLCGIRALTEGLPGGELAKLSEGAPELPRGEQQRLMIARAMMGAPPILVLDEVDSHLDSETASALARAFSAYPGVVIMVATTPAWREAATTIWSIAGGAVTARPASTSAGREKGLSAAANTSGAL